MAKQTIGEFLATLRKANGYTQQEVADRLGISNRTISTWERGTVMPDILLLPALAELYGVTTDEILNGERSYCEKPALTKKTEASLYKNKLARFTTQSLICTGIFCAGYIFFFVGLYINAITVTWVGWRWWLLLLYSGLATAIISSSILIALWKGTESIADSESENYGTFCLLIRKCLTNYSYFVSVMSILLSVVCCFLALSSKNYQVFYLLAIFLPLALIFYLAGFWNAHHALVRWGDNESRILIEKNKKLRDKVALFGLIPLIVSFILMTTFSFWQPTKRIVRYESTDYETFVKYMESTDMNMIIGDIVFEDDFILDDMLVGVYYFALSEFAKTAESNTEIDIGNSFICIFDEDKTGAVIEGNHLRFYVERLQTKDGSLSVYNVRYALYPEPPHNDEYRYSYTYELETNEEGIALIVELAYSYAEVFYAIGLVIIILDALVCLTVCAVKQTKIKAKL